MVWVGFPGGSIASLYRVGYAERCMRNMALILLLWSVLALGQAGTPAEAIALSEQGKYAEAAQAWRTVIAKNPGDAGAYASLGIVLSKQNKYDEAVAAYKKALALDPKLPASVQLNLGLAQFKRNHFAAAVGPFKSVLDREPQNMQARTLLGFTYYGMKQFADAAKQLRVSVDANPENVQLRQFLAQSCLWARNHDCALAEFRKILEKDPNSAAAHMLMGQALDGLEKTPDAIAEFQAAAKVSPKEPNVHFGLGYLYWKSRRYDEAAREFQAELANDPNHAQSMAYLGDIQLKKDNPEKAIPLLRKAIELQRDLRFAYIALGTALTAQKQYPEALAILQQAVKLDPAQADAHYRIARVYQATGKTEEAQKEFAKVRELHQKSDESLTPKMAKEPPPVQQNP